MKWNTSSKLLCSLAITLLLIPFLDSKGMEKTSVQLVPNSIPPTSLGSISNLAKTQRAIFSPDGYTMSVSSQSNPGFISVLYGNSLSSYPLTAYTSVNNGPQDQTMDSHYIYAGGNTGKIWQLPYNNGVAGTLQTITLTPSQVNNQIFCLSLMGDYLYAGNTWGSTPGGGLNAVHIDNVGAMTIAFPVKPDWGTILLGCTPDTSRNILFVTSYPSAPSSTNTLWALDVSNPSAPTTLASFDLTPYNSPAGARVVWASVVYDGSRYLYLTPDNTDSSTTPAANTNQLLIIDTQNLTAPVPSMSEAAHVVGQLQNKYPSLRHSTVFLNSNLIMVTSDILGTGYVSYFDVTTPTAPVLLGYQQVSSDLVNATVNSVAQPPFVAGVMRTSNQIIYYDIQIDLTVTAGGDGHETIFPSTPQTVPYGGTQQYTVISDPGYFVAGVVGGTCPAGSWSGNVYTTGVITADCHLSFNAPVFPVSLAKSFSPNNIIKGEVSTLQITLYNFTNADATLTAPLKDNLPTGVIIKGSATTTCAGTVTASGNKITLNQGAVIPAIGSCTIEVPVTTHDICSATNKIPSGALQTTQGNNTTEASAVLTIHKSLGC